MQSGEFNGSVVSVAHSKPISVVTSSVLRMVRKHYIISGIYVIGLLVALVGGGLSVTDQQRTLYEARMSQAISMTATDIS